MRYNIENFRTSQRPYICNKAYRSFVNQAYNVQTILDIGCLIAGDRLLTPKMIFLNADFNHFNNLLYLCLELQCTMNVLSTLPDTGLKSTSVPQFTIFSEYF